MILGAAMAAPYAVPRRYCLRQYAPLFYQSFFLLHVFYRRVRHTSLMKIAYHFLGCRLNEAENEQIAREMAAHGHEMVALEDAPDVIILNTCGVTCDAMRKSRNLARRMAALHPKLLVLMGCAIDLMASGEHPVEDDELIEDCEKDITIVRILRDDRKNASSIVLKNIEKIEAQQPNEKAAYQLRMRSFIKIQDGCNNQCSYCAVRLARGRERSENANDIIDEIQKCLDLGEKEIVLTGVQLGAWHEADHRLSWLIEQILERTSVQRLRLSSIEPWHVRPELWELWKDKRLCPHFHIPVQSGSNDVLAAMRRRTPIEGYLEKLAAIRECIPGVRISTDLIVGFPGETDEMWHETLEFIERAQFDDAHLFRFSPRPNTIAASLPHPVPADIKRQRWNEAQERIQTIQRRRLENAVGTLCHVLWETPVKTLGNQVCWQGYSEHYLKLMRWFDKPMRGVITEEVFGQGDDTAL